ncbi:MAG: hypothetical protein WD042_08905 [Phycisphaeraceae bacterium]
MKNTSSTRMICASPLVAIAMCLLLVCGRPAEAVVVYAVDDGTSESGVGFGGTGDMWWANFFTAPAGGDTITSIEIAFGSGIFSTGLSNGDAFTVYLYDDTDDNGSPYIGLSLTSSLSLLTSASATVQNADTDIFQSIDIPDTVVNGGFFVAARIAFEPGLFPASLDASSSQGASWVVASVTPIDPSDVVGTTPPQALLTTDFLGLGGNWLLRSTGTSQNGQSGAVPEPVTAVTGMLGLAALALALRRRRCS